MCSVAKNRDVRFHIVLTIILAICIQCGVASVAYADDAIEIEDASGEIVTLPSQDSSYIAQGMWGSCMWIIDNDGTLIITPGNGVNQEGKTTSPWIDYAQSIKTIWFMDMGNRSSILQGSAEYLFSGLTQVTAIDLSGLEFVDVVSTSYMFANCSKLARVTNINIDTSQVVDMNHMFVNCERLIDFDFSRVNMSNVVDMSYMFCMCGQLQDSVIAQLNMPMVQNLESMVEYCKSLKHIDLKSMGVAKVTNAANLFKGCSSLESVELSGMDTSSLVSIQNMFFGCASLQGVDVSLLNTSNVKSFDGMFQECASMTNLDLSMLNTSSLTSAYAMCGGCSNLQEINLSGWDTSQLQNMGGMFTNCTSLTSVDFSGWNTASVTSTRYLFNGCASLASLDLSGWDTSQVTNVQSMFANCKSLSSFTIGAQYIIKNTNMFPNATSSNGKWWSKSQSAWYTKNEIVSGRKNVADTYMSTSEEGHQTSIADATIVLEKKVYAWTGEGVMPSLKVLYNNLTLIEGKDYTISYSNNVDVGANTAKAIVSGMGSYTGSKSMQFSITYEASFTDVSAKTAHVQDIIWLSLNGISTGFPNGTFRPGASVARADMAAFLFRLACKWGLVSNSWRAPVKMTTYIDDVSDTTPHAREIRWLVSTGISKGWEFERGGYTFTRFRPYSTVARQDMAAFLFRLAELANKGGASSTWSASLSAQQMFADVDAHSATNHHNEVWWLAQTGVSEGWKVAGGKREYRGLLPVARQDMAAFLHRVDLLA